MRCAGMKITRFHPVCTSCQLQYNFVSFNTLTNKYTLVNVVHYYTTRPLSHIRRPHESVIPRDHTYASMHTRIRFNRTDGNRSLWPKCGRLQDGGRFDRLLSDDEHVGMFLDKLAVQLAQLLHYPGGWFLARVCLTSKRRTDGTNIWIDSLPEGYGLFSRSNAAGRQDRYLRGGNIARWSE
jgi:hypothetical protein